MIGKYWVVALCGHKQATQCFGRKIVIILERAIKLQAIFRWCILAAPPCKTRGGIAVHRRAGILCGLRCTRFVDCRPTTRRR